MIVPVNVPDDVPAGTSISVYALISSPSSSYALHVTLTLLSLENSSVISITTVTVLSPAVCVALSTEALLESSEQLPLSMSP